MEVSQEEINKREKAAISAIKNAFGTEDDEYGGTLFAKHHLDEIKKEYWLEHLGTYHPEAKQILDLLVLRSHWGEEDDNGIDAFDFTLPENVTDYVISVCFDEDGEVDEISMES